MLSGDSFILDPESNVRKRIIEYGTLVSELHVIILSKTLPYKPDSSIVKIATNISVYPIDSAYRINALIFGLITAIGITAKFQTKKDVLITSQDPFEMGLLSCIIGIIFTLPVQLQVHNDFHNPYFIHESKVNNLRQWMAKFLLRRANNIRVVNNTIRELIIGPMLKISPARITLLPVFVDSDYIHTCKPAFNLKNRYPQFKNIIVMVGRLGKQKNYPLAFDVISRVLKTSPETGLIILGTGIEKNKLKRTVTKLNLNANVIFEGSQNDVVSYYKGSDIFLHTSNYEGYGMVFIEAAAAGIPMVSTAVGVMGDFFIHNKSALISDIGDAESLANNVTLLLNNPALRKELSQKAYLALASHTYPDKVEYLKKYKASWDNAFFIRNKN